MRSRILSPEEENLAATLCCKGPSFQQQKKPSGPKKEISICNKLLLCMAKCNLSLCAVFLKWSFDVCGGRNCVEGKKKKKRWVKGTAQSSERTLKNVLCLSQSETMVFLDWEKKWQSWRSVVSDGAKTFFKLSSLRGGGHYLPRGFRSSCFPFCHFKV